MKQALAIHGIILLSIIIFECYLVHPVLGLSEATLAAMAICGYLMVNNPGRTRSEILFLFGLYTVAFGMYLSGSGFILRDTVLEPVMAVRHLDTWYEARNEITILNNLTAYVMFS